MDDDKIYILRLDSSAMLTAKTFRRAVELFLGYEETEEKDAKMIKIYSQTWGSCGGPFNIGGFGAQEVDSADIWRAAKKHDIKPNTTTVMEKLEENNE